MTIEGCASIVVWTRDGAFPRHEDNTFYGLIITPYN